MIIGKPITASFGGLKPEITVTARAGATLNLHLQGSAIILQTYTLGASETTHTFVVGINATPYVITDATNSVDSQPVLVDTVEQYSVTITYATYLYNEGDECTVLTGGWTLSARDNQTETSSQGHTYVDCYAKTNNTIDLTNYNYLKITLECPATGSSNWANLNFYIDSSETILYSYGFGAGSGIVTNRIDISSITGSHNVVVSASNQTWVSYTNARYSKQSTYFSLSAYYATRLLYIYKVWLE